jgi:malate synthase
LSSLSSISRVEVHGRLEPGFSTVLTSDALEFVKSLQRAFSSEIKELLAERRRRQVRFDSGDFPNFLQGTEHARNSNYRIAGIPTDLLDRRVEITGPAGDRKMMINAMNSGASTYMADFEDSQAPTWRETVQGQVNLREAVLGTIRHVTPEGKVYIPKAETATLIVRPRGLHLPEKHLMIDGEPAAAALLDFGFYLYHNVDALRKKGTGPYFYLPKIESHLEARLWGKVCSRAEDYLGLGRGTIKLTVLIETLPAAFEMDEILYELRDRVVGLNCGRWDYVFSFIKTLRNHAEYLLPDRAQLTMDKGFLAAYVDLLIKTCHRRGAYAIGGMSAYVPVKTDEAANELALQKVRSDKEREVKLGHDGTWVAHPGLVELAKEIFDAGMTGANQLHVLRREVNPSREDLLQVPAGTITSAGVGTNVAVGLTYLDSWLGGRGCVSINGLMEDAATSEICRAQLWQSVRHRATLEDGRRLTAEMVRGMISNEVDRMLSTDDGAGSEARTRAAGSLFMDLVAGEFTEFLTLPAYEELLAMEARTA